MKKRIFEILVNKNNEKGPDVFEKVLVVIHKVFEKNPDLKMEEKNSLQNNFSFEITKIAGKIRFFFMMPEEYADFIKNQFYAQFPNIETREIKDYLERIPSEKITIGKIGLEKDTYFPIKDIKELGVELGKSNLDTYSSITSSLSKSNDYSLNTIQVIFQPIFDEVWKNNFGVKEEKKEKNKNGLIQKCKSTFGGICKGVSILMSPDNYQKFLEEKKSKNNEEKKEIVIPKVVKEKMSYLGFACNINIISASENDIESKSNINEIFSTLGIFAGNNTNSFILKNISKNEKLIDFSKERKIKDYFILNSNELAGIVHFPTNNVKVPNINRVTSHTLATPANLPLISEYDENEITPIGKANFRGKSMDYGILKEDRKKHLYIVGKTGMGKTTLLENMILDDIKKGKGVGFIDPHGDLVERIIGQIPKNRTNSVIVFDPSDTSWPIGFNMFDSVAPNQRTLVASGILSIFKKIFGQVSWGPRLEYILRNVILSLLEYPGATLLSIPMVLTSNSYRKKVVAKITDPVVKNFWISEFEVMNQNQKNEAISPILNKVGQFVSSPLLRNILGQQKNSFSIRWAMDNKKIIIINLSKGKIGEDASSLLGAMLVTRFQLDAMSRADTKESERKNFYLYVDEFQNFSTDSFSTILSEARKYKLNLTLANQFIDQMNVEVKKAIFGNVGSLISFQVGVNDAKELKEVFSTGITEDDLMNLENYSIYNKLLIKGMPSETFSATTYPRKNIDEKEFKERTEKIIQVNRQKYCKQKEKVENQIRKSMQEIKNISKK